MDKCVKCGSADPEQCYNAFEQRTSGWWCVVCGHFEKAILRERQLPPSETTYSTPKTIMYPVIEIIVKEPPP